jgi:hypothetical protein
LFKFLICSDQKSSKFEKINFTKDIWVLKKRSDLKKRTKKHKRNMKKTEKWKPEMPPD